MRPPISCRRRAAAGPARRLAANPPALTCCTPFLTPCAGCIECEGTLANPLWGCNLCNVNRAITWGPTAVPGISKITQVRSHCLCGGRFGCQQQRQPG
jgi:hypothetical protein